MTKLAFQLKAGETFYAEPLHKYVTIQQILDEGLGSEIVFQTDAGTLKGSPYEAVRIPTAIIKLEEAK